MYFEDADPHRVRGRIQPGAAWVQRRLSLDDFLQLQSLLQHEQVMREQDGPHRHGQPMPASTYHWQQQRLQHALYNLKQLKEQYRRERCRQVQRYLDVYRRQALIQAARQEEEERFHRQLVAAALEERRVDSLWRRYADSRPDEACESTNQQVSQHADTEASQDEEDDSDEDQGFGDYHSKQLASLLRLIFDENDPDPVDADSPSSDADWERQHDEDGEEAISEVWKKYISRRPSTDLQAVEQGIATLSPDNNDPVDESESSSTRDGTETSSEAASIKALPPLQNHVLTLQDLINQLVTTQPKEKVLMGQQDTPSPVQQQGWSAPREANSDPSIEESEDNGVYEPKQVVTEAEPTPIKEVGPSSPFGKTDVAAAADRIAREQQRQLRNKEHLERERVQEQKRREQERRLRDERQRQQEEHQRQYQRQQEELERQEEYQRQQAEHQRQQEERQRQQQRQQEEREQQERERQRQEEYQRQQAQRQRQQEERQRQQEEHQRQKQQELEKQQERQKQQELQQQRQQESQPQASAKPLPPKAEQSLTGPKQKALQKVEAQLEEVQEKYKDVFHAPLQFEKPEEGQSGMLILPASTPNNRAFLGCEDSIMRCMLQLDAIESDGQDAIRAERRALVKRAEALLECLDDHKQHEWEKTRIRSHKRHKHKRRHPTKAAAPPVPV